ncbi:MAG: metallophosphoesterase [Bacteroidota bacterium]
MKFGQLFLVALILIIDVYVYQAFKFTLRNTSDYSQKISSIIFWSFTAFSIGVVLSTMIWDLQTWPKFIRTYFTAFVFIIMISKLLILIFMLVDDLTRFVRWSYSKLFPTKQMADVSNSNVLPQGITRSDFLVRLGIFAGSLPFISLLYGMAKGATDYHVRKVKLKLPNLPKGFHGYKMVQISDIHSGSFVSQEPLNRAVGIINGLNPDIILFTGDLVNNRNDEVIEHKPALSKLKSKHGVISILGNHDYGDYVLWESDAAKKQNLQSLINHHKEMGWDILLDEHRILENNGDKISLIGVQNWSTHLRFPKYGSMKKATKDIAYADFNILLSHDPSHWRGEIISDYPKVDLMLAGHTHGFQFGIEIPYFRWSPVQYIYKEWAGLYQEGHQYLYVNRGLGFLGYPGRVGILPEITLFELECA